MNTTYRKKLIEVALTLPEINDASVYDKIVPMIREGRSVNVSFAGVELLIAVFLNSAMGRLYGDFTEEIINSNPSICEIAPDDSKLFELIKEHAAAYYKNPELYDRVLREEMEDD